MGLGRELDSKLPELPRPEGKIVSMAGEGDGSAVEVEVIPPPPPPDPEAEVKERSARLNKILTIAAGALAGLSGLVSLIVVAVLRRGLGRNVDPGALLSQVNGMFMVAIGTFIAALVLVLVLGAMRLARPSEETTSGVASAAVGVSFVALAWASYLYSKLD